MNQWRAVHGCCGCGANFKHLEYFHKYINKVDFKTSGGSLNFQIIIRYFKYFYKKICCFVEYIGSRNEIKWLHSFKEQLNE